MKYEGRTSHEVRGLKYTSCVQNLLNNKSHLTRGAWIEINRIADILENDSVAPHTRCVD